MDAETIYIFRSVGSSLAFCGFLFSCFGLGVIVVCELGVAMGVLHRREDDEDDE